MDTNACVEMAEILDVGAFTLARAQAVDAKLLEPGHPFERTGVFALPALLLVTFAAVSIRRAAQGVT